MARWSERFNSLVPIKLLLTLVWAIMAGSIRALPVTALVERFNSTIILTATILAERGVLVVDTGRCPLTGLSAGSLSTGQTTSTLICQSGEATRLRFDLPKLSQRLSEPALKSTRTEQELFSGQRLGWL